MSPSFGIRVDVGEEEDIAQNRPLEGNLEVDPLPEEISF